VLTDATEVVLVGGLPVAQMPQFHRFDDATAGTGSGPEAGGSRLLLRPLLIRPWRQLLIRTLHHLSRRPPRRTPLRRSALLRRVSRCVERAPVARVYTFPPPIGGGTMTV
jgi:hypothetical protein